MSEINYKHLKPYHLAKRPHRQPLWTRVVIRIASDLCLLGVKNKVTKVNMEGLKPPYFLLSNHMQFVDFYMMSKGTFPHPVSNVVKVDGYYRRAILLEIIGSIGTRKFVSDVSMVKNMIHVVKKNKDVLCMFPEARYSPCGTLAYLPEGVGAMAKKMNVPVVVAKHHGNYLYTPFWSYRHKRKEAVLHTEFKKILPPEQMAEMSPREIDDVIRREMRYDEYRYQYENNIRITYEKRAEGLHKVLYQCPACKTEFKMTSKGATLTCGHCGKSWEMDELGRMHATEGKTEFPHVPDWFEWQRENVKKEVAEGRYRFEDDVRVYSLYNPKKFVYLGDAKVVHDENGFTLTGNYEGQPYTVTRSSKGMYGLHVEYEYCYIEPKDCFDISTPTDSFYCYPSRENVVTKLSFATEEIYKKVNPNHTLEN